MMLPNNTPWNWHETYAEPLRQEVQYEFTQVFLEHHSYTRPEQKPARNRNNGLFISPYQTGLSSISRGISRQPRRCYQ
jgi:hypothetical protein